MWKTFKESIQLRDNGVALFHSRFHEYSHFVVFKFVLGDQHLKHLTIAFDGIQVAVKLSIIFFEAFDLLLNFIE